MRKNKSAAAAAESPAKGKTAAVEIDGVVYPLAYDFNRIADAEREAQCNLLSGLKDVANLSAPQLRGLFLAAIRAGDPKSKLTIDQVGQLIRFNTIVPIVEALATSMLKSVPEQTA